MRYIVMHKVDAYIESGAPAKPDIIENMGALVQESLKSGIFTNGAGLHRSALRARLRCQSGDCTVTRGPYAGENELVASMAMISAQSMDAAIDHAKTLAQSLGDCEIEIGPVVEPWDLGLMPKPEGNRPERFLLLCKAQGGDEAGAATRQGAAFKKLAEGFQNDAALLSAELLGPSNTGSRLAAGPKGKRTWVDGPFAESKELISGFSLLTLPSRADAIVWANRYAAILGDDNEVDVREVSDV
jgi:hypothetical protein